MKKGQLFSLDFLISLVAVMAAIGLLIQTVEFNQYNQQEERINRELKYVSETFADLLVTSNETTCEDSASLTQEHLMGCISDGLESDNLNLLLPPGFDYSVSGGALDIPGNPDQNDFYQTTRDLATGITVGVWAN